MSSFEKKLARRELGQEGSEEGAIVVVGKLTDVELAETRIDEAGSVVGTVVFDLKMVYEVHSLRQNKGKSLVFPLIGRLNDCL